MLPFSRIRSYFISLIIIQLLKFKKFNGYNQSKHCATGHQNGDKAIKCLDSLPTSLVCFENSLDPYQARQNVGPDLDPNCSTLLVFLK